jgi:hypothetical protein
MKNVQLEIGQYIQQGDCIIEKVDHKVVANSNNIPKTILRPNRWDRNKTDEIKIKIVKDNVLRMGSATGHKHVVVGDDVIVVQLTELRDQTTRYILAKDAFSIIHDEHEEILLLKGVYLMEVVRITNHLTGEVSNVSD